MLGQWGNKQNYWAWILSMRLKELSMRLKEEWNSIQSVYKADATTQNSLLYIGLGSYDCIYKYAFYEDVMNDKA